MATPCEQSALEPVGTSSGNALACNAKTIDEVVNSDALTTTNRIGNTVPTLKGLEALAGEMAMVDISTLGVGSRITKAAMDVANSYALTNNKILTAFGTYYLDEDVYIDAFFDFSSAHFYSDYKLVAGKEDYEIIEGRVYKFPKMEPETDQLNAGFKADAGAVCKNLENCAIHIVEIGNNASPTPNTGGGYEYGLTTLAEQGAGATDYGIFIDNNIFCGHLNNNRVNIYCAEVAPAWVPSDGFKPAFNNQNYFWGGNCSHRAIKLPYENCHHILVDQGSSNIFVNFNLQEYGINWPTMDIVKVKGGFNPLNNVDSLGGDECQFLRCRTEGGSDGLPLYLVTAADAANIDRTNYWNTTAAVGYPEDDIYTEYDTSNFTFAGNPPFTIDVGAPYYVRDDASNIVQKDGTNVVAEDEVDKFGVTRKRLKLEGGSSLLGEPYYMNFRLQGCLNTEVEVTSKSFYADVVEELNPDTGDTNNGGYNSLIRENAYGSAGGCIFPDVKWNELDDDRPLAEYISGTNPDRWRRNGVSQDDWTKREYNDKTQYKSPLSPNFQRETNGSFARRHNLVAKASTSQAVSELPNTPVNFSLTASNSKQTKAPIFIYPLRDDDSYGFHNMVVNWTMGSKDTGKFALGVSRFALRYDDNAGTYSILHAETDVIKSEFDEVFVSLTQTAGNLGNPVFSVKAYDATTPASTVYFSGTCCMSMNRTEAI